MYVIILVENSKFILRSELIQSIQITSCENSEVSNRLNYFISEDSPRFMERGGTFTVLELFLSSHCVFLVVMGL